MKEKNKYLLVIFACIAHQILCSCFGLAVVFAEKNGDNIRKSTSSTIQAAEYFIDVDPGKGNGVPLTAVDGTFDGSTESISLNLNTSNLAKGSHYIFIRFKSSEGIWGDTRGFLFNIATTNLERHIISAEYFFDTDTGFGKGTKLTCEDGQFDEKIEDLKNIGIETSNLSIGQHKVYVRAQASDGAWGESVSKSITIIEPDVPPSTPKNLSAIVGDKKVTLNWSANSEADLSHYKIYRSQTHGFNPTVNDSLAVVYKPNTSYIDYAVTNEIKYYYRISAVDNSGNESGFSVEVSATPRESTAPAIPQNFQATAGNKLVTLSWSANTEADLSHYKIYRNPTHGFNPTVNDLLATVHKPNTSYIDNNVTNGVPYYYRISAVDTSGNESDFSDEVSATPRDNIPPAKPKNLQATAGDKKVILSWSPNPEPDLSYYKIYRNQSQNVIPIDFDSLAIVFKPDSSCVDHDVTNGLTYYYVISAVDMSGNESNFSEMVNATPQAGAGSADIALSANHHDFGNVSVFSASSWQLVIENNGSANLVINQIESNNPVFTVAARQFSIAPQNQFQLEIQFQPDSLQSEGGILMIKCNDPDQPELTVTLTGKGIDNQAPAISLQTPAQAMWINSDFQVSAQITDNWAIGSATLHYRKGSDMNFQGTALSQGANHSFSGIIPASAMTYAGLAYFIKAEDSSGNTTSSDTLSYPIYFLDNALKTSRLPGPYQSGYPRGEWFMISVPAVLEQASVSAVLMDETELGNYGEPNWRLFCYQHSDGDNITDSYLEYRSDLESSAFRFDSGKAFWLKANPAGNQIEIDVGAGHVLPLEPKNIQLNPGWNQVGNPFAFPIAFSPSEEQVVDQLYLPDGSGGYQLTTTMQPWAGYFVFVNGTETVTMALAPKSGSLLEKLAENEDEWKMQICASCGASKDEINYLGINELSCDEWDGKDYPEPPGIEEYISLYFPHRNWQPTCENYTTDFRTEIGDGQVWDFNVWTNIKTSDITLTWHIIKNFDTDLQISLYDRNRNEIVNMKENEEYIFSRMGQETLSHFQIFVGNKNFVDRQIEEKRSQLPGHFGLSQNYPNPFNSSTSIQLQVAAPQQVSLKIIDLLGREVRTLISDYKPAGYFQVCWDGKDNRGLEVVTGIYLCVFQTGQYFESRKVLVLK